MFKTGSNSRILSTTSTIVSIVNITNNIIATNFIGAWSTLVYNSSNNRWIIMQSNWS